MANLIAQAAAPCNATNGLSKGCLDYFNTTLLPNQAKATALSTPKGFISELLPYLFTFAGLILFVMLIWGGFEMLSGASDPKAQDNGKQRIMNAVIGFILLFCSYWLAQIVQAIFGINIL